MGITLGATLAETSILDCGPRFINPPPEKMPFCVRQQTADGSTTDIRSLPVQPFNRGLILREAETVTTVALFAPHTDYSDARAVLIERYGPPTRREAAIWKNLAGASIDIERLTWTGVRVELMLNERGSKSAEAEAVFYLIPNTHQRDGTSEKTKKSAANL